MLLFSAAYCCRLMMLVYFFKMEIHCRLYTRCVIFSFARTRARKWDRTRAKGESTNIFVVESLKRRIARIKKKKSCEKKEGRVLTKLQTSWSSLFSRFLRVFRILVPSLIRPGNVVAAKIGTESKFGNVVGDPPVTFFQNSEEGRRQKVFYRFSPLTCESRMRKRFFLGSKNGKE